MLRTTAARLRLLALVLACVAAVTGEVATRQQPPVAAAATPALPGAGPAPAPGHVPERVSPLHDRRGLHPGLTPVPASQLADARALIDKLTTARAGTHAGYDRDRDFGAAWTDDQNTTWGHDGCPTREEILHRDMKGIDFRAGTHDCVVLTGLLQEPYTGRTVDFSKSRPDEVQVDHVMPLAYDWAQGARHWTRARRLQLANDPLNLLAVDGPANQAKSDSGPADWMPPNSTIRCAYAVRFALVSHKYALAVTDRDRAAMRGACRS